MTVRFSSIAFVALSAIVSACGGDPFEKLPPIAGRADQTEAQFDWPWCEAQIPPLHNCGEFGSVSDIGGFIAEENVCALVAAMHEWLASRKWDEFENVRVCRTSMWIDSPKPGESISFDRPKIWYTHIRLDIPDHGMSLFVFLDEKSGDVTFDPGPL